MPLVDEIVSSLNNLFKADLKQHGNVFIGGVAEHTARQTDENKLEWIPCIVDHDGNAQYMGLDDVYDIQIYHKCLSETFKPSSKQYGDLNSNQSGSAIVHMVVAGMRNKVRMSPRSLADRISSLFPSDIINIKNNSTNKTIIKASIKHTKTNYNSFEIYSREYRNTEYFLKPETILFEMVYSIESEFNRSCFNICKPCNE